MNNEQQGWSSFLALLFRAGRDELDEYSGRLVFPALLSLLHDGPHHAGNLLANVILTASCPDLGLVDELLLLNLTAGDSEKFGYIVTA